MPWPSSRLAYAIRTRPRVSVAAAFGLVAGVTAYVGWTGARSASIFLLCGAVALSHGAAGAAVGPRLFQRGNNARRAFATGARASLIALALFLPGFAWWIAAGDNSARSFVVRIVFVIFVGVTTLVAAWWAMILLCGMTAVLLSRIAAE